MPPIRKASSSSSDMFGANSSAGGPGSSTFSTASTLVPQIGLSSFGQNSAPGASSGLFGQTPAQGTPSSQPLGIGSMFAGFGANTNGSNTTTQSVGTTDGQSGSRYFGGFGQTQSQTQPSGASGGLLGNTSQPQNAGSSSIFGASILGGQAQGQQQQANPNVNANANANADVNATIASASRTTDKRPASTAQFQDLIERGNKRQAFAQGDQPFNDIPRLQLGLGDLAGKLRSLRGVDGAGSAPREGSTRAEWVLAASGVPRGSTSKNIDAFSSHGVPATASVPTSYPETDIGAYVSSIYAKTTQDLINESLEQSRRDFDAFIEENIQMDWDAQRRRIYEHFGLAKAGDDISAGSSNYTAPEAKGAFGRSSRRGRGTIGLDKSTPGASFGKSSLSKSVLGGSTRRGQTHVSAFTDVAEKTSQNNLFSSSEDPYLRSKQESYAAKVKELNSARLQGIVYPIVEQFGHVEIGAGSDVPKHLIDGYRALKHITRENANAHLPSEPGAVKERQYAKDYLDESTNSGRSIAIRKQILDGSRRFLEESFWQHVDDVVSKNHREANLGGVPSKINKMRAYVRVRVARKDLGVETSELQLLGQDYCWALVYFLLRAGLIQEANQYVNDTPRSFKNLERSFPQFMQVYAESPDRTLPRDLQIRIRSEYQNRLKIAPEGSVDPYRLACYKIVGRCDMGRKSAEKISTSMEDWMWTLFSLAREVNRVEEAAGEVFGLQEVRDIVDNIGQRHFAPGEEGGTSYATLFLLQVLSGTFEQAVAWLYPHNYVAAVHFAIALDYYGLLRVSDFSVAESELLSFTTREKPQISFARLIGYYTRDFRLGRAEAATDYLSLICLNADLPGAAGQSQATVCHEALKELVLETREFALLLGDIGMDGKRVEGAIEQRLRLVSLKDQDDYLRNLTIQAASAADDSGRTTDAVLLYHLAEEYDSVVSILNRSLADAVAVEIGREQMRLQPLKPRVAPDTASDATTRRDQPQGSLSLTSIDDPVLLAQQMLSLYESFSYVKIRQQNREACSVLISMAEIKEKVAAGQWATALDQVGTLGLLPMHAQGNISLIRSAAQAFSSVQPTVARNIGHLLIWTITCCGKQRALLRASAFEVNAPIIDRMLGIAKDMMVFAGLIKYKLPSDVFEALARAGQDVGE